MWFYKGSRCKHAVFFFAECAWILQVSQLCFTRRTKCDSQHRQRPLSEGTLGCPEPRQGERNSRKQETQRATGGADAWGGGRDLPSLLQEVSLKGPRDSSLLFSDATRQMPRRRVNLFSSLRLRKQGSSKSEGQDQEMQKESGMLLTNIRNDGKWGGGQRGVLATRGRYSAMITDLLTPWQGWYVNTK